jgi:2-polyprenyl-3-methyl-5-hydroxy-6-metoxy-1,4-benzoquinol methylase
LRALARAAVVRALPPATLLRWLCRLDNALYRATSLAAIRYDGGLHPKHRLTGYHDFFVAHVRPGERVLDVGCGVGALAADLARARGALVTGVDLDRRAVAEARRAHRDPRLTFLEADARALPAGRFDVVILSNVLEHLDDRVAFLREVVARAAPGRVLIRVPCFERDWRVPLKQELGVEYRLDPTHRLEYSVERLETEVGDAGLAVQERQVRWGEIWAVCVPCR